MRSSRHFTLLFCIGFFVSMQSSIFAQTPVSTSLSTSLSTPLSTQRVRVYVALADACPICQKYAPTLKALNEKYRKHADFIGIFPDPYTTQAEINTFAKQYPCGFAMQRDSSQNLARKLGLRITPEVAVVAGDGKILYKGRIDNAFPRLGARRSIITEHSLADALEAIVQKKAVKVAQTQAVGCMIELYSQTASK
jgi:thiol-disulfide isomerase/thioredoxin